MSYEQELAKSENQRVYRTEEDKVYGKVLEQ
jgi:hypothetical protein